MLYLRSFNRFILICLALLGLSVSPVNAALFEYQYQDTIFSSGIPGLVAGQSAKITVALDNGSTSSVSQIWTAGNLQSITWDFDNGGLVTTFNSPWGGSLNSTVGNFTTDGAGTLTSVMTSWWDASIGGDFVTNRGGTPTTWFLNGFNSVYVQSGIGFGGSVSLQNVSSMLSASNWSPVSAVPVPAAVWLFGTALIGLVGFGKRRKVA